MIWLSLAGAVAVWGVFVWAAVRCSHPMEEARPLLPFGTRARCGRCGWSHATPVPGWFDSLREGDRILTRGGVWLTVTRPGHTFVMAGRRAVWHGEVLPPEEAFAAQLAPTLREER